jgi:2-keto-4-pentenoate hydratase/2-oxohepta-3-ene-1,7-dioic acid hydratase in catechol pathway
LTHPEAELAVIIGQRLKLASPHEAERGIFGYTIMNDITSITLKSEDTFVFPSPNRQNPPPGFEHGDMQLVYHARSKSTDTFGPCGPWIVTKDALPNANKLGVHVFMGNEHCTEDNTANLRYTVAEVISWASRYFTLEPGDIVHVGTAAGGKYALRELDYQVWDGPCSIEIEGIGVLSNPVHRVDLEGRPVAAKPKTTGTVWPPRYVATN